MTQEEWEQEQRERERLIQRINYLIDENNRLVEQINFGLRRIVELQNSLVHVHDRVEPRMKGLSGEVKINSNDVNAVERAIQETSNQYFVFKALSTATKNLTQYTDEYYTRFSYYNNLRRVTLGYVIGLDGDFVSNEKMRGIVERAYLQNSDYWLAYATMAVMLWASDEREAAQRALDKALFISPQKAALYFMLINLRFSRDKVARDWFLSYMDRVNPSDLGSEWQFLLQAYLAGAFGIDEDFQKSVGAYFKKMLVQSESTTAGFNKRFVDGAYNYEDALLHRTGENFPYLKGSCAQYEDLMKDLSNAEKNQILADYYNTLYTEPDDSDEDIPQRVENVLYALISDYDRDELEVVKKMKYNEHIISAGGNIAAAQKKLDQEFGKAKPKNLADLLTDWAFTEDSRLTPLCVRRFSISFMRDWMLKGYERFTTEYRSRERKEYRFNVDGCEVTCSEHDAEKGRQAVASYYNKTRLQGVTSDKYVPIFGLITLAGVLALIILAVQLTKGAFSPIALTIGVLLTVVGGFLLWRQIISALEKHRERQRLTEQRLLHAIEELGRWRELYHAEDAKFDELKAALLRFGNYREQEAEE